MKKIKYGKNIIIISLIVEIIAFIVIVGLIQSFEVKAARAEENKIINLQEAVEDVLGRKPQNINFLYGLDESADYIYVELKNGGYAIFYKETFELLEYSFNGKLDIKNTMEKIYYNGPSNYYKKENDKYKNILTGKLFSISNEDRVESAQEKRSIFSKHISNELGYSYSTSIEKEQTSVRSGYNGDGVDIDISSLNLANMIPNYQYFLKSPTHGYNEGGTCGAVAAQLLLSYGNYFMDRRIIPSNYLLTNVNGENLSTCANPMTMNSDLLGSSDDYYEMLIDKVDSILSSGQQATALSLKMGIQDVLYYKDCDVDMVDLGQLTIPTSYVTNILDAERPLIIGLAGDILGKQDGHAVVAYGYQNYTYNGNTSLGYITHFGWARNYDENDELVNNGNDVCLWVNSAWCTAFIDVIFNHVHNYSTYVGGDYREEKCSTCGHRRYAYEMTIDDATKEVTIDSARHTIEGDVDLPDTVCGLNITRIGADAFKQENGLTDVDLPAYLEEIGDSAFYFCTNLESVTFPIMDTLISIGQNAFTGSSKLTSITLPASVEEIDSGAFGMCVALDRFMIRNASNLTSLGGSVFAYSNALTSLQIPDSVTSIGINLAYGCTAMEYLGIPNSVTSLGNYATKNCSALTVYTEYTSTPSGWGANWNNGNRPVVWGCNMGENYVISFTKTSTNPSSLTDVKNPVRLGYTFGGWYTTSDFSGTKYDDILSAPNGILYAKWSSSCVAEGTLITLANGSQVAVEDLTGNEQLLVWNMLTGEFDVAPILFIDSDSVMQYEIIELTFSDGTQVKVIDEHAFFDVNLNKYVFLREDAYQYIGHYFNKQGYDGDGNMIWTTVQLVDVDIYTETTTAWSPVTYGHLCYYVNGMLSMPGATQGFINIFEVDTETMRYDMTAYNNDINTYGLFTYEEFCLEVIEIPEVIFNAFNGQYLKVAMGKNLIDEEGIIQLVERYSEFF